MRNFRFAILGTLVAAACGLAGAAAAQPAVGEFLVTEAQDGSVVDVAGGGDVSGRARFATGLGLPMGLCFGPGGDLYVAESLTGEVTIITDGGDFTGAAPFAWNLETPVGLHCTDSQILVAELGGDEVTDITAGGDFDGAAPVASGFNAVDLLAAGSLYVSEHLGAGRIVDISAGGDFTGDPGFAFGGGSLRGFADMDGTLLVADRTAGLVFDFGAGGALGPASVFATVPDGPENLHYVAGLGLFASETRKIYEISAGGDFTGQPAWATGVGNSLGYAGMLYVAGCGDGLVHSGETCDDGNTTSGDGCDAACALEICGNGVVQGDEECDDGNTVEADGCDAACLLEVCGNGVVQAGEACDDGNTVGGDGCDAACVEEICGDGVLQLEAGEECDDGNTVSLDGCSELCVLEFCGDGVLQPSEQCDDGNSVDGDGCDALCQDEVCGNGIVQAGEACDDGNAADEDGCSSACDVEACGDGIVQAGLGEVCDDGNTADGDGCLGNCNLVSFCNPNPEGACAVAGKAKLKIKEKKAGKEKLSATLKKLGDATTAGDFGDPVSGTTGYELCLYDAEGALVANLPVDRAGDTCSGKPCWKAARKGPKYKDKEAAASGVKKLVGKSGPAGKGKLKLSAGNQANKGRTSLPTGLAGALAGATQVTMQVVTTDARCYEATLTNVKKNDATQFKAK